MPFTTLGWKSGPLCSCHAQRLRGAFRSPGENRSSIYEMASRACFKNRLVSTGVSPGLLGRGAGPLGPRKSDFHQPGFSRGFLSQLGVFFKHGSPGDSSSARRSETFISPSLPRQAPSGVKEVSSNTVHLRNRNKNGSIKSARNAGETVVAQCVSAGKTKKNRDKAP